MFWFSQIEEFKEFCKTEKNNKTFPLLSLNIVSIEVRVIDGTG